MNFSLQPMRRFAYFAVAATLIRALPVEDIDKLPPGQMLVSTKLVFPVSIPETN